MLKKRLIRWVVLLAIGFGIGSIIGLVQSKDELKSEVIELSPDDKQKTTENNTQYKFNLIDHEGKEVTQDTYAGNYKLIFFGFTFCPAICPTELQKMNVILDELGDLANEITPIFITIDPERDNVAVMKEYVAQFNPKLIGLTGSQEQIDAVKKSFHAFARKVENEMMEYYMMDHSSFMYFMDKDNNLIAMYPAKDTAMKIASDIKKHASLKK